MRTMLLLLGAATVTGLWLLAAGSTGEAKVAASPTAILQISSVPLSALYRPSETRRDSLLRLLQQRERHNTLPQYDTAFVQLLLDIAFEYRFSLPSQALHYASRALDAANSLPPALSKVCKADALNMMGFAHRVQGEYPLAIDEHLQALSIYESLNHQRGIASALNNIGVVYRFEGSYDKALDFFLRSLPLREALGNPVDIAASLNNIGEIYRLKKDYDKAFSYQQRALKVREQHRDTLGIAFSMNNLGVLAHDQSNYALAEEYHRKALAIREQFHEKQGVIGSLVNISTALEASGKAAQALVYSERARALGEEMNAKYMLKEVYTALGKQYAATGKYERALHYTQRLLALQDSLFNAEAQTKIAALQSRYDLEKREADIRALTAENTLQTTYRNVLTAGVAILMIGVLLLVLRYRSKQRSEATLRAKNAEILRQQAILEEQAASIEITNTELQTLNVELQRLSAEKDEFLGIAAHDLKNPLAGIAITATMLHNYLHRMSHEEIKLQLSKIRQIAERMKHIVNNLLNVNALERGALPLTIQDCDAVSLVSGVVEEYRQAAEAKDIKLIMQTHHAEPRTGFHTEFIVRTDALLLTEIASNLLSNAIKYSPPRKTVWVKLLSADEAASLYGSSEPLTDNSVLLVVQDEGPGLSDEDKSKLFGKFMRLSARPTANEDSTGLGLSIVKKMVEALQGRVWCESTLGNGATFMVKLPNLRDEQRFSLDQTPKPQ